MCPNLTQTFFKGSQTASSKLRLENQIQTLASGDLRLFVMKVLIQHPRTLDYIGADTRWTPDIAQAADFQYALTAISHGVNQLREPFVMLFKFQQAERDFSSRTFADAIPAPNRLLDPPAAKAA